jgi:hypothetical protein
VTEAAAPNWAEIVTAVGTGVLALGVLIAVVSLRELRRDRHLHWIFEIGRRWDDTELQASRLALRKYDREDLAFTVRSWLGAGQRAGPEFTAEVELLQRLPDFFEDVALMRRFGRLDVGLVWQSLSGPVNLAWTSWRPAVDAYRKAPTGDPEAWTEFEELARELAAYETKRTKKWWIFYRWARSLIPL